MNPAKRKKLFRLGVLGSNSNPVEEVKEVAVTLPNVVEEVETKVETQEVIEEVIIEPVVETTAKSKKLKK